MISWHQTIRSDPIQSNQRRVTWTRDDDLALRL